MSLYMPIPGVRDAEWRFKRLQGQTFACEADATAALQAFCQTLKLTEVHEPQIIPARAASEAVPAQGTLSCPIERYQHKLLRKSCFKVNKSPGQWTAEEWTTA